MTNYTTSNHLVSALYKLAEKKGVNTQRLLAVAGVAPELIDEPKARILTDNVSTMVRYIREELQDEFMGISAHPCKPGVFSMLCQLAVHAPNLEEVFVRGFKFYELVVDDFYMVLKRSDTQVTVALTLRQTELASEYLLMELIILHWHRLASWLIGHNIVLSQVRFTFPTPPHVDEYKYILPYPILFEQSENSFSFSKSYLNEAVVQTDDKLDTFIAGCPTNIFVLNCNDNSLHAKIRQQIEPMVAVGMPSLESVADQLSMSVQSVRQKLKAEGSSYQQIKNIVRRDMAIFYLTQKLSLGIGDIAPLVGFSEPGVFIRAFKGWTGMTPRHYRCAVSR